MPKPTRRTIMRLGAGLAAEGALLRLGVATAVGAPPPGEPAPPSKAAPTFVTGSFASAARGVETNWAIARPPGQSEALPPVIALHGKGGDAATVMGMGIPEALAQVAKAGYPAFAVVGVDGGDGYWHRRASGEDAGAMVLTELLPLLAAKGLDTSKVGFIGWSMGGYGALLLGARLGPARTAAICAVSPALYPSYGKAVESGAFDSPADAVRHSVFGAPALSAIPLRVDCGASDRFYLATKQFVASLRRPPSGVSFEGGHDVSSWRRKLPAQLAWLAS